MEMVRTLAVFFAVLALLLGGLAVWLFRKEKRETRTFRERVREKLRKRKLRTGS